MSRRQEKKSKYGSIRGKVREKALEVSSSLDFKGNLFIPKAKTYSMIILPYEVTERQPEADKGQIWYRRLYYRHGNIGPQEQQKMYICPKSIFKPCPICEDLQPLYKEYEENKKVLSSIGQKKRELYNIVLLEDFLKYQKGKIDLKEIIQLFEISYWCFGRKLNEEIKQSEEEEELGGFADFKNGKILKIRFSEMEGIPVRKGKELPVEVTRIDSQKRDDLDEDEVLSSVHDLNTILSIPSYEQLKKAYFELDDGEEEKEPQEKKTISKEREPEKKKDEGNDLHELHEDLTRTELKKIVLDEELDIKITKTMSDNAIREAIRENREEPKYEGNDLDDLDELDRDELKKLIKKEKLEIKVTKKMEDDDIREAIREQLPRKFDMKKDTSSEKSSGKCPNKYTFGSDCGEYDDCDDCDDFDACMEKKAE